MFIRNSHQFYFIYTAYKPYHQYVKDRHANTEVHHDSTSNDSGNILVTFTMVKPYLSENTETRSGMQINLKK